MVRKYQTLYIRIKTNKIKNTASNLIAHALCQSFLCLDVTSSATLLPLLLNTCSKGTEREAKGSPNPLCTAQHTVTTQLLPFYRWFRRGLGISKTALDVHWYQQLWGSYSFCLQLLYYFWLMLLLIWENSTSFFAKHHTFYKYMHTETKEQEDQIILDYNCCQEYR